MKLYSIKNDIGQYYGKVIEWQYPTDKNFEPIIHFRKKSAGQFLYGYIANELYHVDKKELEQEKQRYDKFEIVEFEVDFK